LPRNLSKNFLPRPDLKNFSLRIASVRLTYFSL